MISKNLINYRNTFTLLPHQRLQCQVITLFIMVQCILVMGGSATILKCTWSPDGVVHDYNKLARIMYLYDPQACGRRIRKVISNSMILSNATNDLDILPLASKPPQVTVSTRLSTKTRWYINISLVIHIIWFIITFCLWLFKYLEGKYIRFHKFIISLFFYTSACIVAFDLSMGILYVAHIQQSLTKGMVLRYSGWSTELQLKNYDDFAGWLPIIAALSWTRGGIILILNIYCCIKIRKIKYKIKRREVKIRLMIEGNLPFPEARHLPQHEYRTLHYRTGEYIPSS